MKPRPRKSQLSLSTFAAAISLIRPDCARIVSILSGIFASSLTCLPASLLLMCLLRPSSIASIVRTATWPVNAFVLATPISGPACRYIPASVVLAIDEPTTLTMPSTVAPRSLASSIAENVSSVSPDWLIAMTTVPSSMIGLRYRNSLAYSVSAGMRANCSNRNSPTRQAWNAVPQAVRISRLVRVKSRR